MAQGKNTIALTDLLLRCMAEPDPMLSMPEWLCARHMEAEVPGIVGAEKNAHDPFRGSYRPQAAGHPHRNNVPHGICRGLACLPGIFEP